jgi:hypothetical protein
LGEDEIETCFDLGYHLRHVEEIFRRVGLSGGAGDAAG